LLTSDKIKIRIANTQDDKLYLQLRKDIFLEQFTPQEWLVEKLHQIEALIPFSNYTYLLAVVDRKPVGYIQIHSGLVPQDAHVASVEVNALRQFRDSEVEEKLLKYAEKYAIRNEIHRLEQKIPQNDYNRLQFNINREYAIEQKLTKALYINEAYQDCYLIVKFV